MLRALLSLLSGSQSKAKMAIANALNVKPDLVNNMIESMGPQRGRLFIDHLNHSDFKDLEDAVFTFYIYRIFVKNQHTEEIKWWRNRMLEKGYETAFTTRRLATISTYLKDAGVDYDEIKLFAKKYNEEFEAT